MKLKETLRTRKFLIKRYFLISYILSMMGAGLNMLAIKSNGGIMPVFVSGLKYKYNFIVDRIPIGFNYYASLGDFLLAIGLLYFIILIFIKEDKLKD